MNDKRVPLKPKPPMPGRRNNYEIWAEILENCLWEGRTQSWLLREIRLKTSAIKEALEFLVGAELLEIVDNADIEFQTYQTTQTGQDALNTFYRLVSQYFSGGRTKKFEQ